MKTKDKNAKVVEIGKPHIAGRTMLERIFTTTRVDERGLYLAINKRDQKQITRILLDIEQQNLGGKPISSIQRDLLENIINDVFSKGDTVDLNKQISAKIKTQEMLGRAEPPQEQIIKLLGHTNKHVRVGAITAVFSKRTKSRDTKEILGKIGVANFEIEVIESKDPRLDQVKESIKIEIIRRLASGIKMRKYIPQNELE